MQENMRIRKWKKKIVCVHLFKVKRWRNKCCVHLQCDNTNYKKKRNIKIIQKWIMLIIIHNAQSFWCKTMTDLWQGNKERRMQIIIIGKLMIYEDMTIVRWIVAWIKIWFGYWIFYDEISVWKLFEKISVQQKL